MLEQSLNPITEKKKSPQVLLQKYLADFVYKEDEEDSLLIVYYAGHGNPGSDGELVLTGYDHSHSMADREYVADTCWYRGNQNHPGDKIVDGVAWNQTESLIHVAEKADILLIFDCCFAGKLCGTLDRRAPINSRIFEFLGATVSNGLARLPGKESFTRALIWALEKLAGEEDGFTTSRLYNTILSSPDFPSDVQTPVLTERRGHCLKRLVLAPLPARSHGQRSEQPITPDHASSQQEKDPYLYSLSLQLCFPKLPNKKELEEMCTGLKQLVRSGELQAKQIIWRGMHRKGSSPYEIPHAAHVAAHSMMSIIDRKRKRSFKEDKKRETIAVPQQNPSPTSEKDGDHEQALEGTSDEVPDNKTPTRRRRRKTSNTRVTKGA